MAKHLLLVVSSPIEGRDDDYNRWYSEQHLRDVVKLDGFTGAERFRIVSEQGTASLPGKYVAIYEMETDDPMQAYAGLGIAADKGEMPISDAMDAVNISVTLLTPFASYRRGD